MPKVDKSCPVCLNHYTNVIRQPIQCSYCEYEVCRQCTSQYLLSSLNDPHCVNCKREWNREFIDIHLTKNFRNGALRAHRRKVLIDREKGRLPAMQAFVEAQKTIETNTAKLHVLRTERHTLKIMRSRLTTQNIEMSFDAQQRALAPVLKQLQEKKEEIRKVKQEIYTAQNILTGTEKPEARAFLMKCPGEECRGFLSQQWKCGICTKYYCSDCHAEKKDLKDDDHKCNEDAKATALLIKKETKPCPKCGIRIYKIDGCNQMWCTECHTTFSWDTGQILLNTVVHNPHYYEYLRKNNGGAVPRELGDVPCGGLPNAYYFNRLIYMCNDLTHGEKNAIAGIHRCLVDVQHHRLPGFPIRPNANMNRDVDINYLMNNLTEEEWGSKLEQIENKFEKKKEIGLILQTFIHVGSEKMNLIMNHQNKDGFAKLVSKVTKEMDGIRDFINTSLIEKGLQMGMVVPQISEYYYVQWASRSDMKKAKSKTATDSVVDGEKEEEDPIEDETSPQNTVEYPEEKGNTVMVEIDGEIVEMTAEQAQALMT